MRYCLLILVMIYSSNVFADYWEFTYYLYGKITDKNHAPVANVEMSLVQGEYIRHFKTDDKGNYKVEVISLKGCLSGNQPGKVRFVHAKQEEIATNGNKLIFYAGTAYANMPSKWQEFDSLRHYHRFGQYDSSGKYFRKMDVTLNEMLAAPDARLLKVFNKDKKVLEDACGKPAYNKEKLGNAFRAIVFGNVDFHKRSISEIEKLLGCNNFYKLAKDPRTGAYRLTSPFFADYFVFLMNDNGLVDYYYVVEKKGR